jgi:hypothetical protein
MMIRYVSSVIVSVASALVMHFERTRSRVHSCTVLVDPTCAADAVRLVRVIAGRASRSMDMDTLSDRLERVFRTFRPTERTLRHLSLMQQQTEGMGNEEEFCVVLLFSIAMLCVTPTIVPPTRVSSMPLLRVNARGFQSGESDVRRTHEW